MGKINKNSFSWTGTAKSLKAILRAQSWQLRAEKLKRELNKQSQQTLTEYLLKLY